jgi:hypothetical protein
VNVIRAQADIQIEQRPDRVYEFITDGFERNYPRWSPEVKELKLLSKGPIRVGSLARQVRVDQGRRSESTFKITHMHPDQRLTFQGTTFPFLVDFGSIRRTSIPSSASPLSCAASTCSCARSRN